MDLILIDIFQTCPYCFTVNFLRNFHSGTVGGTGEEASLGASGFSGAEWSGVERSGAEWSGAEYN